MLSDKIFFVTSLCVLILFSLITYKGFGSSVDAEAYLYASETLRNKGSLLTPYGYYTNWTPLFPALIAIFGIAVVQYGALLCNLFLLYWLGALLLNRNSYFHFLFFVHTSFSVVFLMIHFFVWSEAWFLVFLLALVYLFLVQIQRKSLSNKILLAMILLANLLCLQRMAGIFFVFAFGLLITFYFSKKQSFVFAVFGSVGLAAWFVRNSFVQSKPDFLSNIFMVSWQESLAGYARALLNAFLPSHWFSDFWATILFFILLILAVLLMLWHKQIVPVMSLFLCYLLIMCLLRMNVAGESERYLAPIQPLVILSFWYALKQKFKQVTWKPLIYTLLALMMLFQFIRTAKNVKQWIQTPPNLITNVL